MQIFLYIFFINICFLIQASDYSIKKILSIVKEQSLPIKNSINVGYCKTKLLRSNCARVSLKKVQSIATMLKDQEKKYDNKQSYREESNPIAIVLGHFETLLEEPKNSLHEPFACIITHDLEEIIALYSLDSESTVPIKVIDYFTGTEEAFWKWAFEKQYIYASHEQDLPLPRKLIIKNEVPEAEKYEYLINDPLLDILTAYERTVFINNQIVSSEGSNFPLFINVVKDGKPEIPFIKHIIADTLRELGFTPSKENNEQDIEKIRTLLKNKIDALCIDPLTKADIRCSIRFLPEKGTYNAIIEKGLKIEDYVYTKKDAINIPLKEKDIQKSVAEH